MKDRPDFEKQSWLDDYHGQDLLTIEDANKAFDGWLEKQITVYGHAPDTDIQGHYLFGSDSYQRQMSSKKAKTSFNSYYWRG